MIEVYRYSLDGFEFKHQDYHLKKIRSSNLFFKNLKKEDFSVEIDKDTVNHYKNINLNLLSSGCHAFIGKPSEISRKFFLNHLDVDIYKKLSLYKGFIKEDDFVFSDTTIIGVLEKYSLIPIKHLRKKKEFTIIIPSDVIVYNVEKVIQE